MEGIPTPPSSPPRPATLRRSSRLNLLLSNGRYFLTDELHLHSIGSFEIWLASPSVHPHLYLWHDLCIVGRREYNHAIAWINDGPQGYFYNPSHLEEDLLLLCLGEGSGPTAEGQFANQTCKRGVDSWTTQEIWARCVWRIVEANQAPGKIFEKQFPLNSAACYGAVIDLLCVVFHSIAFRGRASWYDRLLKRALPGRRAERLVLPESPASLHHQPKRKWQEEDECDENASTIILAPARKKKMQRRAQIEEWQDETETEDEDNDLMSVTQLSDVADSDYVDTNTLAQDHGTMNTSQLASSDETLNPVAGDTYTGQWIAALGTGYRESMSQKLKLHHDLT